jgi:hypothetical protein
VYINYLNTNILPATHTGRINNMREPQAARKPHFGHASHVVSLVKESSRVWSIAGMILTGKNQSFGKNPISVPLCPPQNPH